MQNKTLRLMPLLLLLIFSALLAAGLFHSRSKQNDALVGKSFSPFTLDRLDTTEAFSVPLWQGNVAVINVFATWCEPCQVEHPALMNLAASGKVNLFGIAWKDKKEKVAAWLEKRGNPYHAVGLDPLGHSTVPLALTGVPETFVLDKQGIVRFHISDALTDDMINTQILPLVEKLNAK